LFFAYFLGCQQLIQKEKDWSSSQAKHTAQAKQIIAVNKVSPLAFISDIDF